MHLFIYRVGDGLIDNELLLGNLLVLLRGFSPRLKGKEIVPCSVELSSFSSCFSDIITPPVVLRSIALCYQHPIFLRLCLIDPLKRGPRPLPSCLLSLISMVLLPFFAEFRDGSYSLNTKTLFHGTPTMHLWTPCYAWTTDADPQRDNTAASEGPGRPQPSAFF